MADYFIKSSCDTLTLLERADLPPGTEEPSVPRILGFAAADDADAFFKAKTLYGVFCKGSEFVHIFTLARAGENDGRDVLIHEFTQDSAAKTEFFERLSKNRNAVRSLVIHDFLGSSDLETGRRFADCLRYDFSNIGQPSEMAVMDADSEHGYTKLIAMDTNEIWFRNEKTDWKWAKLMSAE